MFRRALVQTWRHMNASHESEKYYECRRLSFRIRRFASQGVKQV